MSWLTNAWWRAVFWWKRRTGFMTFGQVRATGRVLSTRTSSDGDALLNLELDPDCLWLTPRGIGGASHQGRVHCELPPWVDPGATGPRAVLAELTDGDRVAVEGTWGFDGVHVLPDSWPSWTFPLEVLLALVRHQPATGTGWFEIHPVTAITRLGPP